MTEEKRASDIGRRKTERRTDAKPSPEGKERREGERRQGERRAPEDG